MNNLNVTILTIFPEMFPGPLGYSLAGRGLKNNIWSLDVINIRDFGITRHKKVDDTPAGGGNGMIMRPDVLGEALDYAISKIKKTRDIGDQDIPIFYPSPRGTVLDQAQVKRLITNKEIIILCGRFEGIDERVLQSYNIKQISIGDYILSGGEIAAYVMLDSMIRLFPGVLNNSDTIKEESFEDIENSILLNLPSKSSDLLDQSGDISSSKLLEYPLYTKPNTWRGIKVPEVLLSGNHHKINEWRLEKSISITKEYRPDLLNKVTTKS